MTVFPEFVTPTDITSDAPVDLRQQERTIGSVGEQLAQHVGVDHSDGRSLKPNPRADLAR